MQIDWVTVGAQIINFLVLVYLLKRFLYGRIVDAMDRRQQSIAATLEDAQHKADAALHEGEEYRRMRDQLEQEKTGLLQQAKTAADAQGQQLLEQQRAEITATRDKWLAEFERDKENHQKTLRQAVAQQVCTISRRVLGDLSNAELEGQIIRAFVRQLSALAPDQQAQLLKAGRVSGVEINSAFTISDLQQAELRSAVEQLLGEGVAITFTTDPELLCGVALRTQGFKIVWNVDTYLNNIEAGLAQAQAAGMER